MRLLVKVLVFSFALLFLWIIALIVGLALTPQKVPHSMNQKLIRFSGTSTRTSFQCPNGELFRFLISLTDNQDISNFSGKIRVYDQDKLLVERKIRTLNSGNLLGRKDVKNVYALDTYRDEYGMNWDLLLVTNRLVVVEFECSKKLNDATLWLGYVYWKTLRK